MCGDMAGDPMLAWVLMGLGLRNLSMAPRQIPLVKSIIRATRLADAERLLAQALAMTTETEIEELVYSAMRRRFPLELADGGRGTTRRGERRRDRRCHVARPARAARGLVRGARVCCARSTSSTPRSRPPISARRRAAEDEWRRLLEEDHGAVFVAERPRRRRSVGSWSLRLYDTPDNPTMVPRRRAHIETVVVCAKHRRRGRRAAAHDRGRGAGRGAAARSRWS